ncbi:hypothetical protein Pelo_3119 [Pelomyxa schiedti]|nr:hypothetical protein Pelo_3119 [Pelomyxa schiedti]
MWDENDKSATGSGSPTMHCPELDTPEGINKWRKDRRESYPTKEKMAARKDNPGEPFAKRGRGGQWRSYERDSYDRDGYGRDNYGYGRDGERGRGGWGGRWGGGYRGYQRRGGYRGNWRGGSGGYYSRNEYYNTDYQAFDEADDANEEPQAEQKNAETAEKPAEDPVPAPPQGTAPVDRENTSKENPEQTQADATNTEATVKIEPELVKQEHQSEPIKTEPDQVTQAAPPQDKPATPEEAGEENTVDLYLNEEEQKPVITRPVPSVILGKTLKVLRNPEKWEKKAIFQCFQFLVANDFFQDEITKSAPLTSSTATVNTAAAKTTPSE